MTRYTVTKLRFANNCDQSKRRHQLITSRKKYGFIECRCFQNINLSKKVSKKNGKKLAPNKTFQVLHPQPILRDLKSRLLDRNPTSSPPENEIQKRLQVKKLLKPNISGSSRPNIETGQPSFSLGFPGNNPSSTIREEQFYRGTQSKKFPVQNCKSRQGISHGR